MEPQWLQWAKELQAIAQIGLSYSSDSPFDVERYKRIREIAAEIISSCGNVERETLLEIFEREEGYATPKVDVRGVVFQDHKVLLVKEASDGGWTLPGGWADVNQSPSESVVREIREESGYETEPIKVLAIYDRSRHGHVPGFAFHVYKIFILCRLVGGEASTSIETSDVGFFAQDQLPDLSLSRVTPQQLDRMFELYHNPQWATDFD